ncbi:hypothetical protein ACJA88_015218 [Fusarium oxysporum]
MPAATKRMQASLCASSSAPLLQFSVYIALRFPLRSTSIADYIESPEVYDEEHKGPEFVSANDSNNYILGKIRKHNIIVTILPHGKYGISSAAGIAKDMLHSFPNVKIGLMVGIGGSAPTSEHNIRLGDIIVSASGNGKGSVFQYDFRKAMQGQEF